MLSRSYCPSADLLRYLRRSASIVTACGRSIHNGRRYSAQAARPTKPHYYTTPIFYINDAPHIGHLYSLIVADVLKRYRILKGERAILCTGTDEHGMKIQQAASKAGLDPRSFCDKNYQAFQSLAKAANVDYDHFIRTSDPDHRFAVQHFWLMLKERGHIYSSKHEGWYSVSDETFYPESGVHLTLDPSTGRKFMASKETGKEVEWTSEENYHFRLSAFRDRLLDLYRSNEGFVRPRKKLLEVMRSVEDGLGDLSVSRPAERLSWGIPVPDDESQTIYVWLDALINYLTKANYPFQIPGQENAAGWPADAHVIGKEIVRFHCIYWPAFLMALDIPVPRQILTHAHWLLGRRKMSKSVGNVVNPFFAIDRFGVDVIRYYMMHDGCIDNDASYENESIVDRWRKDLHGGLGGLASRVMRTSRWSVRHAVMAASQKGSDIAHDQLAEAQVKLLSELPDAVAEDFEDYLRPDKALEKLRKAIHKTNRYISDAHPWELPRTAAEVDDIIYLCAESLRIIGILLQPYMPDTMKLLLDMLGVMPEARTFGDAVLGSDKDYGESFVKLGRGEDGVLFPRLQSET